VSNDRYRNVYLDNHCHFCTASIVQFLPLLADDSACRLALRVWRKRSLRHNVKLHGYVIMPEHVHLLISGLAEDVRKFMQHSLADIARGIQMLLSARVRRGESEAQEHLAIIRARANGPATVKVWKERFRAVPLNQDKAVLVKLDYMHANPVRRGLVSEPPEWPWSSYGSYCGGESPISVDPLL